MRDLATEDGILLLHFGDEQLIVSLSPEEAEDLGKKALEIEEADNKNDVFSPEDVNLDLNTNKSKKAMKTDMTRSFRLSELCVLVFMLDVGGMQVLFKDQR